MKYDTDQWDAESSKTFSIVFFCDKNRYNNGYVFRIETRSVFRDFPANKPDSDPAKLPTN